MPKVSIITVTKDNADTIGRTIGSVHGQTFGDIEYIIIDGSRGSATADVVEGWLPLFGGRLKYRRGSDSGVYDALNRGISEATGGIIGMLHADDVFSDNRVVELVVEAMDADSSIDMVYGDIHYVDSDRRHTVRYYSGRSFRRGLLRYGFAPPHPSLYCRRAVFERHGMYKDDYRVAADFELFTRLLWKPAVRAEYLPIDMVAMTCGGLSTRWRNRLLLNTAEKLRALRENGIPSSRLHLMLRYAINLMQMAKKHARKHT